MADSDMQDWFEKVWAQREDVVYTATFGDLGGSIYTAQAAHYDRLRKGPVHPGWLHHGVFACPPHGQRTDWVHVTSGLSNPWNLEAPGRDPSGESGVGFELCLRTPQQANWAIPLLHHLMAWQQLVAAGALQGRPLGTGQRVPLGGPIDGASSALTWVLVEPPEGIAPSFELPSGKVDWLMLVGVTEAEVQFARGRDQEALIALLKEAAVWPRTDPTRPSLQ